MQFIEKNWKGMLLCLIISTPCWFLGKSFPLIGGPVFAIIAGMIVTLFIHDKQINPIALAQKANMLGHRRLRHV